MSLAVSFFFGPLVGFLFSSVVGIVKEVAYDKLLGKGYFDIMDAVATSGGGALGSLLITLLKGFL